MFPGDPVMLAIAGAVLGLLIGSFLNVVIHRLPIMMERDWQAQCAEFSAMSAQSDNAVSSAPTFEPPTVEPLSLVSPRSRCPHCNRPIHALENIPILSYLLLKGHCKGCGQAISPRYPLV